MPRSQTGLKKILCMHKWMNGQTTWKPIMSLATNGQKHKKSRPNSVKNISPKLMHEPTHCRGKVWTLWIYSSNGTERDPHVNGVPLRVSWLHRLLLGKYNPLLFLKYVLFIHVFGYIMTLSFWSQIFRLSEHALSKVLLMPEIWSSMHHIRLESCLKNSIFSHDPILILPNNEQNWTPK